MIQLAPKIVGIETEYGISLRNGAFSFQLSQDLFESAFAKPIDWDYSLESPARDARRPWFHNTIQTENPRSGVGVERRSSGDVVSKHSTPVISRTNSLSTILNNGGRLYIDHAHPEYSTPECLTAKEVVIYDKAGEHLLMNMIRKLNEGRDSERQIVLYKNNSDHQGHSYGCHENYLLSAPTYAALFNNKAHWIYTLLLPYFVSRQILCGAGKVGTETRDPDTDFQLSQRADFLEDVIGLQTTHHRPIVNTRDEPHADPTRWRRLHVICGDSNLAGWSTYLKVGVTQLILAMLEMDTVRLPSHLILSDPLHAFKTVSRDPDLKQKVRLESRRRRYTALEIQKTFLEVTRRFIDRNTDARVHWEQLWNDWAWTIQALEDKADVLDRRLDWRIKRKFIQSQIERKQIDWHHPMVLEIDIKYHQLDNELGFFYMLRENGFVDDFVTQTEIEDATIMPPSTTRAYLRGILVERYARYILSANWDGINFLMPTDGQDSMLCLRLPDPLLYNKQTVDSVLQKATDIRELLMDLQNINTVL